MTRRDEIKRVLREHQRTTELGAARQGPIERCICGAPPLSHIDHLADMLLAVGP